MPSGTISTWSLSLAALLALGCTPDIGDACTVHSDCSQTGDRLCEPNLPGGYCTIFNCEPGTCPSEAVCVGYYTEPASECRDPSQRRFERTFCMKNCSSQGDCRTGYQCLDLGSDDNPVSATVLENGSPNRAVCAPALPPAPAKGSRATEVCEPGPLPDGSFGDLPGWTAPGADASAPRDAASDASPRDAAVRDAAGRGAEGGP